jgi:hypothetical protein
MICIQSQKRAFEYSFDETAMLTIPYFCMNLVFLAIYIHSHERLDGKRWTKTVLGNSNAYSKLEDKLQICALAPATTWTY